MISRQTALLAGAALAAGAPLASAQLSDIILLDEKNERAYRMVDLDGDGLTMSAGEVTTFLDLDLNPGTTDADPEVLDMRIEGGVPTFYFVTNNGSAGLPYPEGVFRCQDTNGNGTIDTAEIAPYFDTSIPGWNINSEGMGLCPNGDVYFSSDFSSQQGIILLRDLDGSGDTNAAGEHFLFVDGGSGQGGPILAVDTDAGPATGMISTADFDRMTTDGDGIVVYEGFSSACTYSEDALFRFEDKNGNGTLDAGEARLWLNYGTKNPTLPVNPDFLPGASGFLPNPNLSNTSTSSDPACAGNNYQLRIRHIDSRMEGGQRAFYLVSDPGPGGGFSVNVDGRETNGLVFRAVDNNGDDDVNDAGEVTLWYDGASGSSAIPSSATLSQVWSVAAGSDAIYIVDSSNRTYRLEDLNGDGDAHDQAVATPSGPQDEFQVGLFDYSAYEVLFGTPPPPFNVGGGFGTPFISQIIPVDNGLLAGTGFNVSGTPCSFYGDLPEIAGVGTATLGGSGFTAEVRNIPSGVPVTLILGTSTTIWGGIPLPFDLTVFGWSGCNLYVDPFFLINGASGGGTPAAGATDGVASFPLTMPAGPSFAGFELPMQGLVINIFVPDGFGAPTVGFTALGQVKIQ